MSNVDWAFWRHKTEVELWEAAYLSFNIDPDSQKKIYQSYGRSYFGPRNEKVSKCLRLLKDNLYQRQFFSPPAFICSDSDFQLVNLSEFATWCLHIGYDIPKELTALAKSTDSASVTPTSKSGAPSNAIQSIESYPEEINKMDAETDKQTKKPWLIPNPNDPEPAQPWYTPARYFARKLVVDDPTLLTKRDLLASKVVVSLRNASIYKRGGKKPFDPTTIKKALSNVNLG